MRQNCRKYDTCTLKHYNRLNDAKFLLSQEEAGSILKMKEAAKGHVEQ